MILRVKMASVIATLVLWEYVGRTLNPILFAPPSEVARVGVQIVQTAAFWHATQATLTGLAVGFSIAAVAGITLGILSGRYPIFNAAISLQATVIYVTPYVAFIPLLIVWFGLGVTVRVVMTVIAAIFPIMIATHDGAQAVSEEMVEVGKVEGASEWQLLTKIILPGTIPYIATGMRLGVGRAVVGIVVAEMFTSIAGLGGDVVIFGNTFKTASLIFVTAVLAFVGWSLTRVMTLLEHRLSAWKVAERGGSG